MLITQHTAVLLLYRKENTRFLVVGFLVFADPELHVCSGVSILAVRGPENYTRVSGTSLGGGTFLGLSRQTNIPFMVSSWFNIWGGDPEMEKIQYTLYTLCFVALPF